MNEMEGINEIKLPKGVDSISVTQHDDKIVIEFIPEKSKFKEGDFVYEDGRIMIVKSYPSNYHAIVWHTHSDKIKYDGTYAVNFSEPTFRHATEEEGQILIDAMRKDGKRWNAEKKCIEDIPKRKFKAGDKVRIKDGISSETHRYVSPNFTEYMDKFIGKELTVYDYPERGNVICDNAFQFSEDWLEPCSDEPKNGDWAIFWDNVFEDHCLIRIYDRYEGCSHSDTNGFKWENAIKFESKEQFEKVLRRKI